MVHTPLSDFYALLQIPRDASPNDIKAAYHRTLLRLHPDKQLRSRTPPDPDTTIPTPTRTPPRPRRRSSPAQASVDMALLKDAYRTLADVTLRAAYDGSLRREAHARLCGPRPAQVVSLEEFTAIADGVQEWRYGCRCGGMYRIREDDLEHGTHLVGCESCSEAIWVGYEEVATDEEGE